jgi:hypothetical protein
MKKFIFLFGRGATAYEIQIERVVIQLVHLRGGHWDSWKVWRRISVEWIDAKRWAEH